MQLCELDSLTTQAVEDLSITFVVVLISHAPSPRHRPRQNTENSSRLEGQDHTRATAMSSRGLAHYLAPQRPADG